MNREIKFRSWVKSKATNTEWMNDKIEFVGGLVNDNFNQQNNRFAEIIYMQYTGLKDKNGMEIYEGDVIESDRGSLLYVDFSEGAFWVSGIDAMTKEEMVGHLHSCNQWTVVIGNIHENPELLK